MRRARALEVGEPGRHEPDAVGKARPGRPEGSAPATPAAVCRNPSFTKVGSGLGAGARPRRPPTPGRRGHPRARR